MKATTIKSIVISAAFAFPLLNLANGADGMVISQEVAKSQSDSSAESRMTATQEEANRTVEAFGNTKPLDVFENVRNAMADFIESYALAGIFLSLDQAYVLAVDFLYEVSADNYAGLGLSTDEYKRLKALKSAQAHNDAS